MRLSLLVLTFSLLTPPPPVALAAQAEDLAKARIADIASGDLLALSEGYGPDATLHWIGGPLAGTYASPGKLKEVWSKYFATQGKQEAVIAATSETAGPNGTTVMTDVTFTGRKVVKVHYVVVFRDDRAVDEIWQISPGAT